MEVKCGGRALWSVLIISVEVPAAPLRRKTTQLESPRFPMKASLPTTRHTVPLRTSFVSWLSCEAGAGSGGVFELGVFHAIADGTPRDPACLRRQMRTRQGGVVCAGKRWTMNRSSESSEEAKVSSIACGVKWWGCIRRTDGLASAQRRSPALDSTQTPCARPDSCESGSSATRRTEQGRVR